MDRNPIEGGVSLGPLHRGNLKFAVAGAADDEDLRGLLRQVAMDGWVRIAMTREPHTSCARHVLGQEGAFLIVRDTATGEACGCGEYSVGQMYLDGQVRAVPYFGALRIAKAWRNRIGPLRVAFDLARQFQAMRGDVPFVLTSIGAGNRRAQGLLTANLPGMPDYHPAGRMITLAISTKLGKSGTGLRSPAMSELPALSAFLQRRGEQHQFATVWDIRLLEQVMSEGGLSHADFLISEGSGDPEGVIAVWDRRHAKQIVVEGYAPWLTPLRPVINPALSLLGRPTLPSPGAPLSHAFLSHAMLPSGAAGAFALIAGALALARRKGAEVALLGLAADHPLAAPIARRFGAVAYETCLYIVSWKSGPPPPTLDLARAPAPEIAML